MLRTLFRTNCNGVMQANKRALEECDREGEKKRGKKETAEKRKPSGRNESTDRAPRNSAVGQQLSLTPTVVNHRSSVIDLSEVDSAFMPFPEKLMLVLDSEEFGDAIWWNSTGDSFCLIPKEFSENVLPHHFSGTKFESFNRKLNRWGFRRIAAEGSSPPGTIAYQHDMFIKGRPDLLKKVAGGQRKCPSPTEQNSPGFALPESSRRAVQDPTELVSQPEVSASTAIQLPSYELADSRILQHGLMNSGPRALVSTSQLPPSQPVFGLLYEPFPSLGQRLVNPHLNLLDRRLQEANSAADLHRCLQQVRQEEMARSFSRSSQNPIMVPSHILPQVPIDPTRGYTLALGSTNTPQVVHLSSLGLEAMNTSSLSHAPSMRSGPVDSPRLFNLSSSDLSSRVLVAPSYLFSNMSATPVVAADMTTSIQDQLLGSANRRQQIDPNILDLYLRIEQQRQEEFRRGGQSGRY